MNGERRGQNRGQMTGREKKRGEGWVRHTNRQRKELKPGAGQSSHRGGDASQAKGDAKSCFGPAQRMKKGRGKKRRRVTEERSETLSRRIEGFIAGTGR